MSPDTPAPCLHPNRSAAICALSAAAWLLLAASVMADPAVVAAAGETRAARISIADLNLATAEGMRTARKRVRVAAQRLCWQFGDTTRATNRATMNACVRDTVAETMNALEPQQIAALGVKP
jgi:UrcA family protein